jgi:hypothetical protein
MPYDLVIIALGERSVYNNKRNYKVSLNPARCRTVCPLGEDSIVSHGQGEGAGLRDKSSYMAPGHHAERASACLNVVDSQKRVSYPYITQNLAQTRYSHSHLRERAD